MQRFDTASGTLAAFLLSCAHAGAAEPPDSGCDSAFAPSTPSDQGAALLQDGSAAGTALREIRACIEDRATCTFPVTGPGVALVSKDPAAVAASSATSLARVDRGDGRFELHVAFAPANDASIVIEITFDCGRVTSANVGVVLA